MARYGYFAQLPSYLGGDLCFKEISRSPRDVQPPSLHRRSRGKHQPGDGDYVNRYVFSDCVSLAGGGIISLSRSGVNPGIGIYREPCGCSATLNVNRFIQAELACRVSGPQGNKWYGILVGYYFDNTRWFRGDHPIAVRLNRDIYLGPYSSMSHAQAWAAFSGYISLYAGATFEEAKHLRGVGSETVQTLYNINAREIVVPELRFTPTMDYYHDRQAVGDYTLNTRGGIAAAFVDAADKLPSMSGINNIANAVSALEALKSALGVLIGGDKLAAGKGALDAAKSAWLSYRYVYNTTKADCEEALSYMNRAIDLSRASEIVSNGVYTESDWTVRCSIHCTTDSLGGIQSKLEKYGLALSAYNAWDMVPYSFIVDWFADVGGFLESCDKRNFAMSLHPLSIWYSIERRWTNEYGFYEIYYYRFSGNTPDLSWVSRGSHGPRVSTWVKRGFDLVSLFS